MIPLLEKMIENAKIKAPNMVFLSIAIVELCLLKDFTAKSTTVIEKFITRYTLPLSPIPILPSSRQIRFAY